MVVFCCIFINKTLIFVVSIVKFGVKVQVNLKLTKYNLVQVKSISTNKYYKWIIIMKIELKNQNKLTDPNLVNKKNLT